jgi:hypothetical protein
MTDQFAFLGYKKPLDSLTFLFWKTKSQKHRKRKMEV